MIFNKDKLKLRLFQQTILSSATNKNVLCVIPTGLGKTHIAIALASLRLAETQKVLMLAPTRPLVNQHKEVFSEYFSPDEELNIISGETPANERPEIWSSSRIIFSTPQTIKNELISSKINLADVSLVIFDEAHHASGDYDYNFIAKTYVSQAKNPRILALTASPGTDQIKINEICNNLFIDKIESRDRDHAEVKEYVKEIESEYVFVSLPDEINAIRNHLELAMKLRLAALCDLNLIISKDLSKINKKQLLAVQRELQHKISNGEYDAGRGISIIASLLKIYHAHQLIESESLRAIYMYFEKLWVEARDTKVKATKDVVSDFHIRIAKKLTEEALQKGLEHPKIDALNKICQKQLEKNTKSKIIVFSEFRSNVKQILSNLLSAKISAEKFIGQSSINDKGMSQETQSEIIQRFSNTEFNVLVATSVAEEGIDIPAVDLVVFYSPVPSAIRTIQRRGRTGRQEMGKMITLITKDTKDEAYYWIAKHKEKQMSNALKAASSETITLNSYLPEKQKIEREVTIFADNRERGHVTEKLFELGVNLKIGTLKVGDFILSEDVGVERKEVSDFLASLTDGRLFSQAKKLSENFNKPLMILEGDIEQLFSLRQINKNAIYGALASLTLDWKIPFLISSGSAETAEILNAIARREQLEQKKAVSIRGESKPKSFQEMQEFFIEGLPAVGPNLAKRLLEHFKTPKAIANASEEDLTKVEGLGDKKAKIIKRLLDSSYSKN